MPASRSAEIKPSNAKRVLDVLVEYDGFLSLKELAVLLDMHPKRIRPALWWLQKVKAIEAVNVQDEPFWFACPDNDQRQRHIDERRVEDEPRKTGTRRARKPKEPKNV